MDKINALRENIRQVFLGNEEAVEQIIRCLLARGHLLIEDVPGVGKTVLATAIARSVDCKFSRIQLTPDMIPADVLGVTIHDRTTGEFVLKKGPIFTNILLADEINRTTPRTQTALLEAMNEAQISIDGKIHKLDQPFMVLATQNPYEFEGTYLLPENQLDRFLMRIRLGYPDAEAERRILELRPAQGLLGALRPVLSPEQVVELQAEVDQVKLDRTLMEYIIAFANATREHPKIRVGLSPRGSLALAQAARATAFTEGRDNVIPEDILENVESVCSHRVITGSGLSAAGPEGAIELLQSILESIESPV